MALPEVIGEFGVVKFDPAEDVKVLSPSGVCWIKVRGKAVNRKKDNNGQWTDADPLFIDIVGYGPSAQNLADSIAVGDLIMVRGYLEERHWEDEKGEKRSGYRIHANDFAVSTRLTNAKSERVRTKENIDYLATNAGAVEVKQDGPAAEEPPF